MLRSFCSCAAVGCLSMVALSFAMAEEPASGKVNDEEFVTKAAIGGSTEVALAKLAQQRATDPEVKKFADKMATDHTKANNELLTLAGQKAPSRFLLRSTPNIRSVWTSWERWKVPSSIVSTRCRW